MTPPLPKGPQVTPPLLPVTLTSPVPGTDADGNNVMVQLIIDKAGIVRMAPAPPDAPGR